MMPRYYFDVSDGVHNFEDRLGIELRKIEDVPEETESLLLLLAYEHLKSPRPAVLKAFVRDATGRSMFRATMVAGEGGIV